MRAEAVDFLRTLTPEQRRLAVFGIGSPERLDWHFVPRERAGLPSRPWTAASAQPPTRSCARR